MTHFSGLDFIVIALSILGTIGAALYARAQSSGSNQRNEAVAGRVLGPWVLALSAGATANSGFVLTGAIGLGYSLGYSALLLPLGWLIGDIIFWTFLAKPLLKFSVKHDAVTVPEIIQKALPSLKAGKAIAQLIAFILIGIMTLYIGGQWLSAGKMAAAATGFDPLYIATGFAGFVLLYTAFSGTRGATYTDFVQAIFMILLVIAVGITSYFVFAGDPEFISKNALPEGFFSISGDFPSWIVPLSLIGFATAGLGFSLGQPQMVVRFMSANSSDTIDKARWIYIGFVQLTWLSYTVLGIYLRQIAELDDPEQSLVYFVKEHAAPGVLGLLIAGGISAIASTVSSQIAACVEMARYNMLSLPKKFAHSRIVFMILAIFIVGVSLITTYTPDSTVMNLVLSAVSLLGAALAPSLIFIVIGIAVSTQSILCASLAGLITAYWWSGTELTAISNEALPGIMVGIAVLFIVNRIRNANRRT